MNDLRTAAQQALEALEASGCLAFKNIMCRCSELCGSYTAAQHLRAALAQQAEPVAGRAFLERILAAMEGVIDVADRKTDEFDALRSCVIDLIVMLHAAPPQQVAQQAEPLNLSDPAIQKRLAAQWGYVPAAQAEPVEPLAWLAPDGSVRETPAAKSFGEWVWGPDDFRPLYIAPPQRKPLTEKEMYIVEEEARKNFRLAQAGPRGQMITYWDSLTPWLIRAVERAHGIKE